MPLSQSARLRVAAIQFLNPAPLLWNFEHSPQQEELRTRYDLQYMLPSLCAEKLRAGEADLGLVPIAALPSLPGVVAVPGCVIASRRTVRSIQFILRPGTTPATIRTVAADAASRSSTAYLKAMLQTFYGNGPQFTEAPADLGAMLGNADAALLIGDAALLALDARDRAGAFADHTWIDVAEMWHDHTQLPWVAAVWAVKEAALDHANISRQRLIDDLQESREAGLQNVARIALEWQPRIGLSEASICRYLTNNISYTLNEACMRGIERFYGMAAQCGLMPPATLRLL